MQSANRLLRTLKTDTPAYGGWQMLPGTNLTRTLCRSSPYISWLLVDLEHGNISDDGMHEIVAAAAACGVSPIVRVPEDSGAHGILVPVVESVGDVEKVVRASRFPPKGNRGFESLLAIEKFVQHIPCGGVRELTGREYLEQADESLVIAVQIETKGAFDAVEEIAAVDGVDVLFVGPFDLGIAIGHPVRADGGYDIELVRAIQRVSEAAKNAGKISEIYCDSGEQGRRYADQGFRMISVMTDMVGLKQVFRGAFAHAVEDISQPYGGM
ncbi:Pyruvate/Phosphoenolpyruvate kinase-like domain-containing protein [Aspergillus karnatakaensis]|uniref:HpcH/HpaI aldolase family protein n=1 Tax=Aspergillus karnatakaensis TaxID=1810916 RepID=UPI003CCD4086